MHQRKKAKCNHCDRLIKTDAMEKHVEVCILTAKKNLPLREVYRRIFEKEKVTNHG